MCPSLHGDPSPNQVLQHPLGDACRLYNLALALKRHSRAATSISEGSSEPWAKVEHKGRNGSCCITAWSIEGLCLSVPPHAHSLVHLAQETSGTRFHSAPNRSHNLGLCSVSQLQNCVFLKPEGWLNSTLHLLPCPQSNFCFSQAGGFCCCCCLGFLFCFVF